MNPPSTRIHKRRALQRPLPDPHQTPSILRRRSSRVQSKLRAISIPHTLGSYYESQSPLEQRPTDPQTSQLIDTASYTRVPASGLIEVSAPAPSKAQFQESLYLPQTHNDQTRKRRSNGCIETDAERPPKRARLTKKNLKAFEKLRGRTKNGLKSKSSRSELNSSRSEAKSKSSTTTESTSKTVSTTDSSFPRLVFENGVLDPLNSAPPRNLGYLQDRLDRARDTESPTESEYQDFVYRTQEAPNEQTMLLETSKLLKEYPRGYRRVYNQAFNDFPKSVGFNTGLSATQPDMIEGLDLGEFRPFPVRHQLGGAAVPTSENNAITLPHLAGEWKAGGKDMMQARTQAAYDGAHMVYGRNDALSFLESPDSAGHAYVQTFTTDGTTLNTFAHYSSKAQGQLKYHQFPTSSSFLVSSYKNYKESRRRLRNLEDDTKETSEKLRDELNKKWSKNQRFDEEEDCEDNYKLVPPPPSASIPAETADFADCNSDDEEEPTNQLLTEYWTSFSANNQDESFVQIPAADSMYSPPYASFTANNQDDPLMQISTTDNGYTSLDALITPPQSSKDTSRPLKSSEDIHDSNVCGHKRTRRTRTRAIDPTEGLRDVDHEYNVRKTRKKR